MIESYGEVILARDEVSASSAGGAPFLISYGATFIITAILSFFLPKESSALTAMFQGAVALPIAFWLEQRMGASTVSSMNPLRKLSAQLALSQAFALPFLIVVYSVDPSQIPVVMAGLGSVHFLPYSWLHRTWIYTILALLTSIGAFALEFGLGALAYSFILLFVGLAYWITVPFVYRHAQRIAPQE